MSRKRTLKIERKTIEDHFTLFNLDVTHLKGSNDITDHDRGFWRDLLTNHGILDDIECDKLSKVLKNIFIDPIEGSWRSVEDCILHLSDNNQDYTYSDLQPSHVVFCEDKNIKSEFENIDIENERASKYQAHWKNSRL